MGLPIAPVCMALLMGGGRNITLKEIVQVVYACAVWGPLCFSARVMANVENEAAVAVMNSGYSKVGEIMHLIRSLFFIVAFYQISLSACHIPGTQNGIADAISRDNLPVFFSYCRWRTIAGSYSSGTGGTIGDQATGLDIGSLVPVVQELFSARLSVVYKTGRNRYVRFCCPFSFSGIGGETVAVSSSPVHGGLVGGHLPSHTSRRCAMPRSVSG